MTSESAILGMLADLYKQNAALAAENAQLRQALADATDDEARTTP